MLRMQFRMQSVGLLLSFKVAELRIKYSSYASWGKPPFLRWRETMNPAGELTEGSDEWRSFDAG